MSAISSRRFWKHVLRCFTLAAVISPLGLAVAAHAVPDRLSVAPASDAPSLAFGEYLVNLGRISEGQAAGARFRFSNTGTSPLEILGLSPSCGCLTPQLNERNYAAGRQGQFVVFADTAGEGSDAGDVTKQHYVDVRYKDGSGQHTARVHLKFTLPARRVTIEPRALKVYQFNDQPTTSKISITDRRMPPLNVIGIDCPTEKLQVTWENPEELAAQTEESEKNSLEAVRARISVTVPKAPERSYHTVIRVLTDDVAQPVLYLPIEVNGPSAIPARNPVSPGN